MTHARLSFNAAHRHWPAQAAPRVIISELPGGSALLAATHRNRSRSTTPPRLQGSDRLAVAFVFLRLDESEVLHLQGRECSHAPHASPATP
eukprot:3937751-Rhodomonas_salina.2